MPNLIIIRLELLTALTALVIRVIRGEQPNSDTRINVSLWGFIGLSENSVVTYVISHHGSVFCSVMKSKVLGIHVKDILVTLFSVFSV